MKLLQECDLEIQRLYLPDMSNDVRLTIELKTGFEVFGHYETWTNYYVAKDREGNEVSAETLAEIIVKMKKRKTSPKGQPVTTQDEGRDDK